MVGIRFGKMTGVRRMYLLNFQEGARGHGAAKEEKGERKTEGCFWSF